MLEQPILPALPEPPGGGGSEQGPDAQYFANNPPGYKWKVLSTVIFGIFMVILDTTVVNVAFQTIRTDFGGSLASSQWVISIYVLALGITTPLAGFLANRFGGKTIYLGGLSLFVLGSLMCGLSPNLRLLIVARAIQGIGGGVALPLGTALLLQAFPPREQGTALGIFGIAALVAPAVGPILGGWLVDQGLWRVIFFINPPIGLIGVLLGRRFLRNSASPEKPRFDLGGVITSVIGFGAILYATSIAATLGWTSPVTLACFVVGMARPGRFRMGRAAIGPKIPCSTCACLATAPFLNASLLGYVSTVALFGAEFLMPIYLQSLRGQTALQTGIILLPMAIAGGIFVTLSGQIYDKIGPRPLLVGGFLLAGGQHLAAFPNPGQYADCLDPVPAGAARPGPGDDRTNHHGDRPVGGAQARPGARFLADQRHPPGGPVHRGGRAGDRAGQHAYGAGHRLPVSKIHLPGRRLPPANPVGLCEVPPASASLQQPVLIAGLGLPPPNRRPAPTALSTRPAWRTWPVSSAPTRSPSMPPSWPWCWACFCPAGRVSGQAGNNQESIFLDVKSAAFHI